MPPLLTTTLDDFNRANEDPAAGWSSSPDGGAAVNWQVSSNVLAPTLANAWMTYSTSFPADQFFAVQVTAKPGGTGNVEIEARFTPGASYSGYGCVFTQAGNYTIVRYVSAAFTTIKSSAAMPSFTAGDWVGISCVGSTVSAWHGTSLATLAVIGSVTDTNVTGAGRFGLYSSTTATRVDNLTGGALVGAGAPRAAVVRRRRR